ncbi:MAG: single-stranded-DNA-specific exonuclease RecJ [Chloroflexota bacterium]|nr:single-stranded-DNA-specific exonuclease RecJ [Chloroflexota bacterium]
MINKKWQLRPPLPADTLAQRLRNEPISIYQRGSQTVKQQEVTPMLVQLLHNRGITDPAHFESYLNADEKLTHSPALLPDIDKAVARILQAVLGNELVAIYGDFDADGITATVLLAQGISYLGGHTVTYIPHRSEEGHGLNRPALNNLKEQGVSLIITVDCGITGYAEAQYGREIGLDIIITDHHIALDKTPPSLAAIDPKLPDATYPFCELSGVGVAFKLLQALFQATHKNEGLEEALDLVVLGTVADMVPLQGENRYLVKQGLEVLNKSQRIGVQELVLSAGLEMGRITTENISYLLAPRLNASGRLDHAITSYELLETSSREEARRLAATLEFNNSERQRLTAELFARAKESLLVDGRAQPLLMISGPEYPSGIAGVVSGKLVDEFYRPSIVVQVEGDTAKGSARSIPEFNLVAAFTECQDLFSRFGGHHQAAGFVMPRDNVEQLYRRLLEIAERELSSIDLQPAISIDAAIPLSKLNGTTYKLINMLEPFGQANQPPVFLSQNVKLLDSRRIGSNKDHLKLKLRDGTITWDAIAFDLGNEVLSPYIDIVYNLKADSWGGKHTLGLNILDFVPSV